MNHHHFARLDEIAPAQTLRWHRGPRPFDPGFGPFSGGPFGGHGGPFGGPFGRGRARRGDVRAAVLALLAERPMHGYEGIQELEARTSGLWRPSPGSVYPTLQLLEDEGLVEHDEERGKRRYRLTDAGRTEADGREGEAPWEQVTAGADPSSLRLRDAVRQLIGAVVQVGRAGTTNQREQTEKLLAETRRRIYALLVSEETES